MAPPRLSGFYTTVVAPSLVGFILATNVLIWVMLGGRATIVGPVIAAVLVNAATPELSTSIPLYWQGALGLVFIFVIVLMPHGLLPGLWHGVMWLLSRWKIGRVEPAALVASGGQRWFATTTSDAGRPLSARGDVVLEVHRVAKNFGSFQALADVNFQLRCGELVSIVGPNGAGKTSLVRCICDGEERSGGSVMVCARPIGRSPPDTIVGLGVGCKFQGASVFKSLTVGECLRIASWKGGMPSMWRRQPTVLLPTAAAEVVERLGLSDIWDRPAHDISHGQRQALELAMVVALEPRLLVLDEPTTGLTAAERAAVRHLLTQLAASGRLAILLIEHDFDFVKEISTRIVVLHEGRILADGTVAEVADSKLLKDVYLGRSESRGAP
jgi:branched-chain amino acid transport system permease protein